MQSWEEEVSVPVGKGAGLSHREGKQDSSSMKSGCKRTLPLCAPFPLFIKRELDIGSFCWLVSVKKMRG